MPEISQPESTASISSQIQKAESKLEDSLEEEEEPPRSKAEGLERWKFEMTQKFLRGEDPDFEYEVVDQSTEWDDEVEARDEEERWFDEESPEWLNSSDDDGVGNDRDGDGRSDRGMEGEKGEKKERIGTGGETGIQDF